MIGTANAIVIVIEIYNFQPAKLFASNENIQAGKEKDLLWIVK